MISHAWLLRKLRMLMLCSGEDAQGDRRVASK
jgi:hypothetical protein